MGPGPAALASALCEIAHRAGPGESLRSTRATSRCSTRRTPPRSPRPTGAPNGSSSTGWRGARRTSRWWRKSPVADGDVPDLDGRPFFLVDPLDGTREFIGRNGDFTVNIALVEDGAPTAAVVHLPALDETFWTGGDGKAWRARGGGAAERIRCRQPGDEGPLTVIASRSHRSAEIDTYLERFEIARIVSAGSSLKFCRIAEGAADLYPAARPHDGMGHRGGPCDRRGGRRQRRNPRRRPARVRQAGVREPPLRGPRGLARAHD